MGQNKDTKGETVVKAKKRGNPNIRNLKKTGPRTKEGKLRSLISSKQLRPYSKSKILNYFKKCDRCPLRPRTEKRWIGNKQITVSIPSRCASYKAGGRCALDQGDLIRKLEFFFDIGEKKDTLELQKALTYSIIEDAELAKNAELMKDRRPGFYTHKFKELASKNLTDYNKIVHGEKKRIEADINQKVATININDMIKEELEIMDKEEEEENKN